MGPIIEANCLACHTVGGTASPPLDRYEFATAAGPYMANAVASRSMPPFGLDNSGDCETFEDARWLEDEEIGFGQSYGDEMCVVTLVSVRAENPGVPPLRLPVP